MSADAADRDLIAEIIEMAEILDRQHAPPAPRLAFIPGMGMVRLNRNGTWEKLAND